MLKFKNVGLNIALLIEFISASMLNQKKLQRMVWGMRNKTRNETKYICVIVLKGKKTLNSISRLQSAFILSNSSAIFFLVKLDSLFLIE